MRVTLRFRPREGPLVLPVHYHPILQGFIYRHLDAALARWFHNEGYRYGKRRFKMFTFSRILGRKPRYDPETRSLSFTGTLTLKVSAVDVDFLESFATYLVRKRHVELRGQTCDLVGVEVEMTPPYAKSARIRTLSPITVYRTLEENGRKRTHFFHPEEEEFGRMVLDNLARKARALWGEAPSLNGAWIRPRRIRKQVITYFKTTLIKGWDGEFEIHLPKAYFPLMLDAGLGAKNAQGFGMVEVVPGDESKEDGV